MPHPARTALRLVLALAVCVGVSGPGCGGEPETPEAQVRRLLAELEEALEGGDVAAVKDHVSEAYEDAYGHDRQALGAFLTFQVMRHGSRHLLVRVRDVALRDDGRATVLVHAGLAGTGGAAALSAEVYEVEMDWIREDGAWRLLWADWKPAPAGALL